MSGTGEVANFCEIDAIPAGNGEVPVLGEVIVAALFLHWRRQGRLGGMPGHVVEAHRQDIAPRLFGLESIPIVNVPQGIESWPMGAV